VALYAVLGTVIARNRRMERAAAEAQDRSGGEAAP
jgi:hypothetical protein